MSDRGEQKWAIYRKTPTAEILLGRVNAPDQEAAISAAIEKLDVTNRNHQQALIARRLLMDVSRKGKPPG